MTQPTEPQRIVASVLVIAADPNIESLVGELVAFAGHRPVYDPTAGAAGESVRRVRPDITLLDTSLPEPVVRACLNAAEEVGSRPVLISSSASISELVEEARAEHCLYFPLPGGPKPLERILERAIAQKRERPVTALPKRRTERPEGAVHPALCAALASVARARALSLQTRSTLSQSRALRAEVDNALAEGQRSRVALRAAVTDYACQLKGADMSLNDALVVVSDAISDCATVVGAEAAMPTVLLESEGWTREAYAVA